MRTIEVLAITDNGKLALKNYCSKYKDKKPTWRARVVQKALPYTEEVDDLEKPSKLVVTLSKVFEGHAHVIIPRIEKSIINVLGNFGGKAKDFKVTIK